MGCRVFCASRLEAAIGSNYLVITMSFTLSIPNSFLLLLVRHLFVRLVMFCFQPRLGAGGATFSHEGSRDEARELRFGQKRKKNKKKHGDPVVCFFCGVFLGALPLQPLFASDQVCMPLSSALMTRIYQSNME